MLFSSWQILSPRLDGFTISQFGKSRLEIKLKHFSISNQIPTQGMRAGCTSTKRKSELHFLEIQVKVLS